MTPITILYGVSFKGTSKTQVQSTKARNGHSLPNCDPTSDPREQGRGHGHVALPPLRRLGIRIRRKGSILGVDSFSILFSHRSFQKPIAISPKPFGGCLERRIPGKNGEVTPRSIPFGFGLSFQLPLKGARERGGKGLGPGSLGQSGPAFSLLFPLPVPGPDFLHSSWMSCLLTQLP